MHKYRSFQLLNNVSSRIRTLPPPLMPWPSSSRLPDELKEVISALNYRSPRKWDSIPKKSKNRLVTRTVVIPSLKQECETSRAHDRSHAFCSEYSHFSQSSQFMMGGSMGAARDTNSFQSEIKQKIPKPESIVYDGVYNEHFLKVSCTAFQSDRLVLHH
jgi:hypothetical protein